GLLVAAAGCVDPADIQSASYVRPVHVEDWRDEVIYQVLVDRFADGDPNNNWNVDKTAMGAYHGGDWQGIIDRLDYLEDLGVTALWISPVVQNIESDAGFGSYHGYWTQNFLEVNPHFGDIAKLRELVDECHRRSIKVILDIVTNHIGQLFYYDINGNGQPDDFFIGGGGTAYGSGNNDFPSGLTRTSEWDPEYDSRGVQAFTSLGESGPAPVEWVYEPHLHRVPPEPPEFQNPAWYNRRGRVTVWRFEQEACQFITQNPDPGHWYDVPECRDYIRTQEMRGDFPGGLKDLDTTRQDVRDALFRVFAHWIEAADFDGFRIDTLKHVEHEFWQDFCPRIRRRAKELGKHNFFMFGEAFDGHDDLLGLYTGNGQVDSVFYFSQKFRVYEGVFIHGNPSREIEDLLGEREVNYTDQPNVDGPVDAGGQGISPRKLLVNFLDNHDVGRFRYLLDDTSAHHNALFYLLTQDGIPCIYYGTEQRFSGGNDPANREDLWLSGYDRSNGTFRTIQTLIALRKQYAPLRRGDFAVRWSTQDRADGAGEDAGIFAFERTYAGETALVVLNTSNSKTSRTRSGTSVMSTAFPSGTTLVNVFCMEDQAGDLGAHECSAQERQAARFVVGANGALDLPVPPRGGMILVRE
ncbi:MAG: alpha-amylase family glycosyl hydrolase, partial [Polyangia bacterium]|nr:alpha-amylase family glycosyl hydrolase [Polyangia bacterium]